MNNYSIALALQDFMPVILSSVGLFYIAEMIATAEAHSRWPALLGAWLVMLGGGTKAAWKLNIAATGANIVWMDNALFVLMTPDFIFLAYTLWRAQRAMRGNPVPLSPVIMIVLLQGLARVGDRAEAVQWTEQLLNSVSNAAFAWAGFRLGRDTQKNIAAWYPRPARA